MLFRAETLCLGCCTISVLLKLKCLAVDCMNSFLVFCMQPHLMLWLNFREVFKEDLSEFNIPGWQQIRISVTSAATCHSAAARGMNWITKSCNPQVTVVGERVFFSPWRNSWGTSSQSVLAELYDGYTDVQSSECKYPLLIWKRGFVEARNLVVLAGGGLVVLVVAVRFFPLTPWDTCLLEELYCPAKWVVCLGIWCCK